jgi:hypothetical protein
MDKNKYLVWEAAEDVLPEGARPSAEPAAAPDDKLPAWQRRLILVALTVLSWAIVGGIAIVVVAVVRHLDW